MPDAVRYLGASPNAGAWEIPDEGEGGQAQAFEDLTFRALRRILAQKGGAVRLQKTRRTQDGGKDVVIEATVPLQLLDLTIPLGLKERILVYVEIKYTSHTRLREDFITNLEQVEYDPYRPETTPDYFLLVTNGTITPYVHFLAQTAASRRGARFYLLDKYLLFKLLDAAGLALGEYQEPQHFDRTVLEYQTDRQAYVHNGVIDIYLLVRSYAAVPTTCSLRLTADNNWNLEPASIDAFLDPLDIVAFRLVSRRIYFDGLPDLRIGVEIGARHAEIRVENRDVEFSFEPLLFGRSHLRSLRRLERILDRAAQVEVVVVAGAAGVGKSRLIDELLRRRGDSLFDFARIFFEDGREEACLAELPDQLGLSHHTASEGTGGSSVPRLFEELRAREDACVVVLEDVHHASAPTVQALKALLYERRSTLAPLIVIITGRDDHTFPNPEFFSFLDLARYSMERKWVHYIPVVPLEDLDTRNLIRATIRDVPLYALDKIHRLSENVPFYVVEFVEYLLEMDLVRIINRNTVGIPNVEKFSAKNGLPDSIAELYGARLDNLSSAPFGGHLVRFLATASYFGYVIPTVVRRVLLDGHDNALALQTLIKRRFVRQETPGQLTFAHENLLHFLRDYVRDPVRRREEARQLLDYPRLLSMLGRLDQGEVFFLAGDLERSVECFAAVRSDLRNITNFSSEDLPKKYFPYLDYLFAGVEALTRDPHELRRIVLAKAYMSVHNFPLYRAAQACESALKQVKRIGLEPEEELLLASSIQQLRSHGLLNMGRTDQARRGMLELDSRVRTDTRLSAHHELEFDLYDRLQELYKKYNHYAVAEAFGLLSERAAKKSGDPKLLTCHYITQVGMDLYRDPQRSQQLAQKAHAYASSHGASRLKVYTSLSLEILKTQLYQYNREKLEEIQGHVRRILELALRDNLSDSLMRAQLAYATLEYYLEPGDGKRVRHALSIADQGIDSSLRHGNGLFIWLFYNLKGVVLMSFGSRLQQVDENLRTGVEYLDHQGLLFLGEADGCYPNLFVVTNYIRFLAERASTQQAYSLLENVEFYDSSDYNRRVGFDVLVRDVLEGNVLLRRHSSLQALKDPNTSYFLPLL